MLLPCPVVPRLSALPPACRTAPPYRPSAVPLHHALGLLGAACALAAQAQPAADPLAPAPVAEPAAAAPAGPGLSWAAGLALVASPRHAGGGDVALRLAPLWALRWGRFRVSGARASGLLATPGDSGSGASAELLRSARWQLGAALRVDGGRRSADDPALAGLPDLRRTLRGRLFAGIDLGDNRRASLAWSHDLLGRGGGGTASADLDRGWPLGDGASVSAGAGLSLADATSMRAHFGVSPEVAAATGRRAWQPGAGVVDLHVGSTLRWPLGPRWLLVASVGASQLQGDAAGSPLTSRRTGLNGALTLAWRSP